MTSLAGQEVLAVGRRRARMARVSPMTIALLAVLLAVLFIALFGPMIAPHGKGEVTSLPFDPEVGVVGTDHLGRDVLSRILHGGRPIVIIPVVATALATLIGGVLGIAAAALRRDDVIMRAMDVFAVIPSILVALVLFHRFGAQHWVLALAVIIASIPFTTRYARAAAFPIIHSGYVEQARMIGEIAPTILVRDVLPNLVRPLFADAGLRFIGAIYLVAAAGFLGFGRPPPSTDWGSMISENIGGAGLNPWATIAPSVFVLLLTIPVNLLADRFAKQVAR
ncbi:MAG: ABC transporter permease [Chloroflexi bacterium]|nr:ABC transporter permease [Chloroflexota bacterium]MYF23350.1 ABC transporter permease [Chloroflexota bacterium]